MNDVWTIESLDDCAAPGDKGVGLKEMAGAGLSVPPTIVVRRTEHGELKVHEVFAALGVADNQDVIVRSSVMIPRVAASSVSGLYPSRCANRNNLDEVLSAVYAEYFGPDRATEALFAAGDRRSYGMVLLVQPFIQPDFSGIAHAFVDGHGGDGASVRLSLVAGHLASLVEGRAGGLECELIRARFESEERIAVIAREEDAETVLALPHASRMLDELFLSLSALCTSDGVDREIEWAASCGRLWYLQSQPLIRSDAVPF